MIYFTRQYFGVTELSNKNNALVQATVMSAKIQQLEAKLLESNGYSAASLTTLASHDKTLLDEVRSPNTTTAKQNYELARAQAEPLFARASDNETVLNQLTTEFTTQKARWLDIMRTILQSIQQLDASRQEEKARSAEVINALTTADRGRMTLATKAEKCLKERQALREELVRLKKDLAQYLTPAQRQKMEPLFEEERKLSL